MFGWLLLLVTKSSLWAAETGMPVTLSSETPLSSEGYFVLNWASTPTRDNLQLQQISAAGISLLQAENLPASGSITITGLDDGTYSYHLLDAGEPVSDTVSVQVRHHSLGRAFGFFGIGLLLFGLLVASIVVGSRIHGGHRAG